QFNSDLSNSCVHPPSDDDDFIDVESTSTVTTNTITAPYINENDYENRTSSSSSSTNTTTFASPVRTLNTKVSPILHELDNSTDYKIVKNANISNNLGHYLPVNGRIISKRSRSDSDNEENSKINKRVKQQDEQRTRSTFVKHDLRNIETLIEPNKKHLQSTSSDPSPSQQHFLPNHNHTLESNYLWLLYANTLAHAHSSSTSHMHGGGSRNTLNNISLLSPTSSTNTSMAALQRYLLLTNNSTMSPMLMNTFPYQPHFINHLYHKISNETNLH
ncbi:unnamed protein product, partial [Didymodactylos carnosus]